MPMPKRKVFIVNGTKVTVFRNILDARVYLAEFHIPPACYLSATREIAIVKPLLVSEGIPFKAALLHELGHAYYQHGQVHSALEHWKSEIQATEWALRSVQKSSKEKDTRIADFLRDLAVDIRLVAMESTSTSNKTANAATSSTGPFIVAVPPIV